MRSTAPTVIAAAAELGMSPITVRDVTARRSCRLCRDAIALRARYQLARRLRDRGWSFQRIADQLGYRKRNDVMYLLRRDPDRLGTRSR